MFSLFVLALLLFLGISLSSALREAATRVYLRNFDKSATGAKITAGLARAAAVVFAALLYLCIGGGILGLIYAIVLFGAYTIEIVWR